MVNSLGDQNILEETEMTSVLKIVGDAREQVQELVVREFPLTIELNGQELVTMLCTPADMKYLAIGFLVSEGLIGSMDQIKKVVANDRRGVVKVETKAPTVIEGDMVFKRFITSGCGKGTSFSSVADALNQTKVESDTHISVDQVYHLMELFLQKSEVHKTAGGVHSAALCSAGEILVLGEDVGRHNAVDKIFGRCLWEGIPTADRIMVTSGRISSEILGKVARQSIPLIISRSATTDMAIRTAVSLGVTLIGYVRGKRMTVYANSWRVKDE